MARFHVGQRIKKVRGDTNVGTVATVVSTNITGYGDSSLEVKRETPWVNGCGYTWGATETAYTNPANWEPLTDSNDLVSWESMRDLWVPEHLRIKA